MLWAGLLYLLDLTLLQVEDWEGLGFSKLTLFIISSLTDAALHTFIPGTAFPPAPAAFTST